MLRRPAFFALLAAAGIAAAGYGCDLEDREAPKPNPKPIGGAVAQAVGPGGTGANGGGGSGGEGGGSTTTGGGGGGGDGGGGNAPTPAEVLFPFCGCMEAGADAGACADCLWSPGVNLCVNEDLACDQSGLCVNIRTQVMNGPCDLTDPACIETIVLGFEAGVGTFANYLDCACVSCVDACQQATCQ